MGVALLAKLPKRVWGKSRNVTDNSPTRLGALRAALSYPKHSEVSWVWLAIVILDNVKCTLRGENSSDFPYISHTTPKCETMTPPKRYRKWGRIRNSCLGCEWGPPPYTLSVSVSYSAPFPLHVHFMTPIGYNVWERRLWRTITARRLCPAHQA